MCVWCIAVEFTQPWSYKPYCWCSSITGDPLHSRAACTQPCNVNTHNRAHCSPGARLCEQWEHGCVNNGARLCASARLCRGSPVSIVSGLDKLAAILQTTFFRMQLVEWQVLNLDPNFIMISLSLTIPHVSNQETNRIVYIEQMLACHIHDSRFGTILTKETTPLNEQSLICWKKVLHWGRFHNDCRTIHQN